MISCILLFLDTSLIKKRKNTDREGHYKKRKSLTEKASHKKRK